MPFAVQTLTHCASVAAQGSVTAPATSRRWCGRARRPWAAAPRSAPSAAPRVTCSCATTPRPVRRIGVRAQFRLLGKVGSEAWVWVRVQITPQRVRAATAVSKRVRPPLRGQPTRQLGEGCHSPADVSPSRSDRDGGMCIVQCSPGSAKKAWLCRLSHGPYPTSGQ